jgi:hypothetical protein
VQRRRRRRLRRGGAREQKSMSQPVPRFFRTERHQCVRRCADICAGIAGTNEPIAEGLAVQVMEGDSLPPPPKCSHEPLRRPRSRALRCRLGVLPGVAKKRNQLQFIGANRTCCA